MATKAMIIEGCSEPHRAELLAPREGLLFAWKAGFHRVFPEGNAKNVYSGIKKAKKDLSANGSILNNILMYPTWFSAFDCGSISRTCNKVATI